MKRRIFFWDNKKREIDVSSLVKPSDVIFFNGFNFHEIKPVYGDIGRIGLFEIPTYVSEDSINQDYSSDGDSRFIRYKRKLKTRLKRLISKI